MQLSSDQSFGQSSFGDGGLLPGLTGIASSGNIVGPFNAVAGEAGPEAILPLTQTSQGLGVSATGLTGTDVRIFIIEGVDRDTTDRLEREILELDASIEFRAGVQAESLLLGGL